MRRVWTMVAMLALAGGAVACVVAGAIRGLNAPGGVDKGERIVYGFEEPAPIGAVANAVDVIGDRISAAGIGPDRRRVYRKDDTIVMEVLGVGFYELGRLRVRIIETISTLEIKVDDDGADFMTALKERVRADPLAVVNGITTGVDTWTSSDGVAHRDDYLRAVDREETIGAGEARQIGCLDRHSSTVASAHCTVSGRHAIERYLMELGKRDPASIPYGDHVIGYQLVVTGIAIGEPSRSWRTFYLQRDTRLDGRSIISATVTPDRGVAVEITPGSMGLLAQLTEERVGHKLAIIVDDEVRLAPIVPGPMRDRELSISIPADDGETDQLTQATALALAFKAGSLPPLVERSGGSFTRDRPGFIDRSWMFLAPGLGLGVIALLRARRRGKVAP